MIPIAIEPCTRTLGRPPGTLEEDCGSLQICDTHDPIWGNVMRSAWLPTKEERLAIMQGAPVILQIVGKVHPVVNVFTGALKSVDATPGCGNVPPANEANPPQGEK